MMIYDVIYVAQGCVPVGHSCIKKKQKQKNSVRLSFHSWHRINAIPPLISESTSYYSFKIYVKKWLIHCQHWCWSNSPTI